MNCLECGARGITDTREHDEVCTGSEIASLRAERDALRHQVECAGTPFMADVLAERDRLAMEVERLTRERDAANGAAELLVASAEALQAMETKILAVTGPPSAGHDLADEALGRIRVAHGQRDDAEARAEKAERERDAERETYATLRTAWLAGIEKCRKRKQLTLDGGGER